MISDDPGRVQHMRGIPVEQLHRRRLSFRPRSVHVNVHSDPPCAPPRPRRHKVKRMTRVMMK